MNDIPKGWALYDGDNCTPNIKGRALQSYDNTHAKGIYLEAGLPIYGEQYIVINGGNKHHSLLTELLMLIQMKNMTNQGIIKKDFVIEIIIYFLMLLTVRLYMNVARLSTPSIYHILHYEDKIKENPLFEMGVTNLE